MQKINGEILKIVQIKTRDRIIIPKVARDKLKLNQDDHIAFIEDDGPGLRLQKVKLEYLK